MIRTFSPAWQVFSFSLDRLAQGKEEMAAASPGGLLEWDRRSRTVPSGFTLLGTEYGVVSERFPS